MLTTRFPARYAKITRYSRPTCYLDSMMMAGWARLARLRLARLHAVVAAAALPAAALGEVHDSHDGSLRHSIARAGQLEEARPDPLPRELTP